MNTLTLAQKIGQRLVTGFSTPFMSEEFIAAVRTHKIANVVLFKENIESCAQLKRLCADIQALVRAETGYPAFITIDQEGGVVTRLPEEAANIPGAMAIAATGDPKNAYRAGLLTGQELISLGVNFNLSPCVDINCNPDNPVIGVRSYADNPKTVSEYALQMMKGLLDGGVLCSAKHFPGHGDTGTDSHLALPCVDKPREELEQMELAPYRAAIAAGIPAIMTTHILFPQLDDSGLPATMSRKILTDLLRGELHFGGLIISDCMQMKAIDTAFTTKTGVLTALGAGVDLCFVSHNTALAGEIAAAAVESAKRGELDIGELDASIERILNLKKRFARPTDTVFDEAGARKTVDELLEKSITAVNSAPFALGSSPLCLGCPPYRTALIGNVVDSSVKTFPELMAPLVGGVGVTTGADPTDEEIAAMIRLAVEHTSVVIGTYNGHLHKGQLRLAQSIAQSGIPTAVVAQRNPYDLCALPQSVLTLAVYEYSSRAVAAAAEVLLGRTEATGRLPVRL